MTDDDPLALVAKWANVVREGTEHRNRVIRAVATQGEPLRAIAAATDMSVEDVRRVIHKGFDEVMAMTADEVAALAGD